METTELQNMLIARIRQIDDKAFLKAIKTITDAQAEKSNWGQPVNQKTGWHTAAQGVNKPNKSRKQRANEDYFDEMEQFLRDI